ncbi:MAG TPA: dihydrodipicolinate synthase family protein [Acidobacteriaceae bacterium]|nr:dihydrodipicolinate synthase family protein [Acidobacteriaceae bacterium]
MTLREKLKYGMVIPAHPLALTAERKLDERRQRALTRYYRAAGAGGVAVGVHTTQFAIRNCGLLRPVLELAAEEVQGSEMVKIAGACGTQAAADAETELARTLGYDAVLLRMDRDLALSDREHLDRVRAIASILPVVGFYLQPAAGGRFFSYQYWRALAEIENIVAIKIAPFNRYQTIDVVRAVADAGRADEIALYTGNDDNILVDLLTEFSLGGAKLRIVGGLLGHWAVWTKTAVEQLAVAKSNSGAVDGQLLTLAQQITDSNAAFFDAANRFSGCIAGIHEVLRRQGLLEGTWCLDPSENLSPGQREEIDRVYRSYPHLNDDAFVREHLDAWLR